MAKSENTALSVDFWIPWTFENPIDSNSQNDASRMTPISPQREIKLQMRQIERIEESGDDIYIQAL